MVDLSEVMQAEISYSVKTFNMMITAHAWFEVTMIKELFKLPFKSTILLFKLDQNGFN